MQVNSSSTLHCGSMAVLQWQHVYLTSLHIFFCVFVSQNHDEQFQSDRLVRLALGVAKGMEYLSKVGYVHRVGLI